MVQQIEAPAERIQSWRVSAARDGNAVDADFGNGIVMRHLAVQFHGPPCPVMARIGRPTQVATTAASPLEPDVPTPVSRFEWMTTG